MRQEQEILFDNVSKRYYTNESILRGILRHTTFTNGPGLGEVGDANAPSSGAGGPWWDCVCKMGAWYQNNVHTYQGTVGSEPLKGKKFYNCPLIGTGAADDCSGFVKSCLQLFGLKGVDKIWVTTAAMQPGSAFDKLLRENGFTYLVYSADILRPGDIMCGGASTHTEIYAGNGKSYSWGNIHDGIHARKCKKAQGMPCFMCKMNYKHIWRHS